VVLGGEKGTHFALEDEIGLDAPLDRLLDVGIGLVDEVPDPFEDLALPVGQGSEEALEARGSFVYGSRPGVTGRARRRT